MPVDPREWMQRAIAEAEGARGSTGDNPWVGCVIVGSNDVMLALGHTQGPGEDHAEIAALQEAKARGLVVSGATLYSTLEPCSFHGRTPACSRVVIEHGLRRVVIGMRDPHPRVDGEGIRILRDAGVEVIEGIGEAEVRRQLGSWVLVHHPREPLRRARALLATLTPGQLAPALAEIYAIDLAVARQIAASAESI
jgi:diaminohydroxyphosphoribosylaminopyrimidine deaminase/5-amino-6-(5-phosphoribosylamino)uracil reductase